LSKAPQSPSRPAEVPRTGSNAPEVTVSELAGAIKRALEDGFGYVRLRGEISGYRGPHSSGHCYFALKDDKAKIEAVIWRGVFGRLAIRPEEGMEVIAQGKVTTFPGSSKYQIVIETMEPAGVGALMAVLEERKRKLAAEGLFAPERKRKLPFWPRVVGIVTSPTGAVIRDMLHGFDERCPVRVVVWPVRVQGEGSAAEVAAAVKGFNAIAPGGPLPVPEVLIVARGGGSLEDLWGFNDEAVVRAVAESRIPVISAVGHETDWTLVDLVADARAPTPTKAAEWAVPKHADLIEQSADMGLRLGRAARRVLETARAHLKAAARGLPRLQDIVALPRQRFDAVERRLGHALVANTRAHGLRHARIAARLSPRLVASRVERARNRLDQAGARAKEALARTTHQRRNRFERLGGRLQPGGLRERIGRARERLAALDARGRRCFATHVAERRRHLEGLAGLMRSLSYQSVLQRGFALVRDNEGRMIRAAGQVAGGMALEIEFADGRISAQAATEPRKEAAEVTPSSLSKEPRRRAPKGGGSGGGPGGQGTLF
jgi:exodeoxyribonuclease VII large subunit